MNKLLLPLLGALSLAGCGGGDNAASTSAAAGTRALAADRGQATASAQALDETGPAARPVPRDPPQWGALHTVYEDPAAWHPFDARQVTLNDQGDVYVAWLSRHQGGAIGGVTDVWVRQYSAKEERWLAGAIVAVVPNTDDGRVQDVQVVSVGNDILVVWDVAVTRTTFDSHQTAVTDVVKPGRLHFTQRARGQGTWSAPAPIPGFDSRPVGSTQGWQVAAVGDRRMAVFWHTSGGTLSPERGHYMASLYTLADKRWGPAQVLSEAQAPRPGFPRFAPLFNRQGEGMVTIDTASFQFAPATAQWNRTPLLISENTAVVDDEGHVHSLNNTQDKQDIYTHHLTWRTLSATTRQVGAPVHLYSGRLEDAQLFKAPYGRMMLTWTEDDGRVHEGCRDCPAPVLRRSLTLPENGQPVGQPQTVGQPARTQEWFAWQMSRSTTNTSAVSVWNVSCLSGAPLLCKEGLFSSALNLQGQWSDPIALPLAPQTWGNTAPYLLKTNTLGHGVLIQAQAAGTTLNTRVQVFASVLKPVPLVPS